MVENSELSAKANKTVLLKLSFVDPEFYQMGRHSRSRSRSFDRFLEGKRRESKKSRKEKKERRKERETEDERRERRENKRRLKNEPEDSTLPGRPYSNTQNPFNDPNLSDVFVWGKKLKAEGKDKLSKKEIEKMNRAKIEKNIAEMEDLKRSRDARQSAKEDAEMIARDEERRKHADWRKTEDAFFLKQSLLRSKIRIKEGRPNAIDLLGRYSAFGRKGATSSGVDQFDEYEEFELVPPTVYLKNLTVDQLEDLIEDIKVWRQVETEKNPEFWDDIQTLAKFELKKLTQTHTDESIHSAVLPSIEKSFEKKTFAELSKTADEIRKKIQIAGRGVDVSYWEVVLAMLEPKIAKTRLTENHVQKQKFRLEQIRSQQRKETEKFEEMHEETKPSVSGDLRKEDLDDIEAYYAQKPLPFTWTDLEALDDEHREKKWLTLREDQLERFTTELYYARQREYSPKLVKESDAMPGFEILDEKGDVQKRQASQVEPTAKEKKMMEVARSGMSKEESSFAVEAPVEDSKVTWTQNIQAQKPRYFNRVNTGFDWNKYNQTHYDMDNPPPKIVQGYRFNIFYPDLLDVTKTPSFTLTECEDPDFAILTFSAGPPYEKIAFKIVNREWDANPKSNNGYRCQFANGVFQLWFFFKQYRYRR
ncbi:Cactin [Aphelenchoides besseyi]|nr:Cactin [Aphelenchoides besseyi]KAI6210347.1 Cactin [Aphelenchoides besseyi]